MIKRIKKHYEMIILFCILSYISFLLFYKLWEQSLWIDEWFSSYVAKYMSINWLYKSKYFLFEWLQAICFKIWWFSDFWARFPSVIAHIFSVLLMYLIPSKLCKNKLVGLFSALVFGLLYWELWRWRDARFYSLLQFLFLLWIYIILLWSETKKTIYLNLSIILIWIWSVFHPFLYNLWAILLCMIVYQYKKIWDFKTLFSKKYIITRILIVSGLIGMTLLNGWGLFVWGITSWLSWNTKKFYFNFYNSHLRWQLWLIYIIWIIAMINFIIKKSIKEIILLVIPFLLFIYALVIKWYLRHSRYALLMFPLIILSVTVYVFKLIKPIKSGYVKINIIILLLSWSFFTANFSIKPKSLYYFDYTSPQPDFKSAYASIPDWSNVISWFPTLCDWYYSDRWTCFRAIRVDMVHDWNTAVKKEVKEGYTKLSYLDWLWQLSTGTYYFVMDNLTARSGNINWELYDDIYGVWKKIYESWSTRYNNIVVMEIFIE